MLPLIATRTATAELLDSYVPSSIDTATKITRKLAVVAKPAQVKSDFNPDNWRCELLVDVLRGLSEKSFASRNGKKSYRVAQTPAGFTMSCTDTAHPTVTKVIEYSANGSIRSAEVTNTTTQVTHNLRHGDLALRLLSFDFDQAVVGQRH